MEAPTSTWETSISRTVPRLALTPLYAKAVNGLTSCQMV
jgi:hypothetical protein